MVEHPVQAGRGGRTGNVPSSQVLVEGVGVLERLPKVGDVTHIPRADRWVAVGDGGLGGGGFAV